MTLEEQQTEGLEGIPSEEGMCERGATHTLDRLQRQIISILRTPAELDVNFATQIAATAFLTKLAAGKVKTPGEADIFVLVKALLETSKLPKYDHVRRMSYHLCQNAPSTLEGAKGLWVSY